MPDEREILFDRITARREERGLSERQVSMIATGKPDVIRDMKRRKSTPNGPAIARIAEVLGTTTDWLLGRAESPAQPTSEVGFRDIQREWRGAEPGARNAERLPVYGTGYCDDLEIDDGGEVLHVEQTLFEPDHVIQLIERPPALWAAKDAYAIYFHGSSMEPRFYQGEIGIVQPARPPGPGDFVVVQLNDGRTADVVHVLVKRLVRQTATTIELEQFNPPLTFRIDRKRVARLHLITSPTHLYL